MTESGKEGEIPTKVRDKIENNLDGASLRNRARIDFEEGELGEYPERTLRNIMEEYEGSAVDCGQQGNRYFCKFV